MSRWLVTGAGGMLGRDLVNLLRSRNDTVIALEHRSLDITNHDAVQVYVDAYAPDAVVNCAAWTNVDEAELDEPRALQVNGDGPRHLAQACASTGVRFLHVSTDYVFSGDASSPYAEDAPTSPLNAYGRSKLLGEQAVRETMPDGVYILRSAWLYGAYGPNFVATMIDLERTRETVDVVDDQVGQPTWTMDLATRIVDVIQRELPPATYHATNSGETSWYGLAREVFRLLGADPDRVRPTTSDRFPRPALRPRYSVLGSTRWAHVGMTPMRDWRLALEEAFPLILAAKAGPPASSASAHTASLPR